MCHLSYTPSQLFISILYELNPPHEPPYGVLCGTLVLYTDTIDYHKLYVTQNY
jgi:hypothetical protein